MHRIFCLGITQAELRRMAKAPQAVNIQIERQAREEARASRYPPEPRSPVSVALAKEHILGDKEKERRT